MKARPRAAFVVTVSMLALGCGKTSTSSECKPPDCHMNPPPPPTNPPEPTPSTISANPPAFVPPPAAPDAGTTTTAVPTTLGRTHNPPPFPVGRDAGRPLQ